MGKRKKNSSVEVTEKQETKEKSAIEEAIEEKVAEIKKSESEDNKEKEVAEEKENSEESPATQEETDKAEDVEKKETDKDKESGDKKETDKDSEDKQEEKQEEKKEPDDKKLSDEIPGIVIPTPYIDSSIEKYKNNKKKRIIVLSSILAILVIAYIVGVVYYGKHFSNNTYLNGYDISNMTVDEVEAMLHQNVLDVYSMDVVFKNGVETISVGDGNMYVVPSTPIATIKTQQNPFMWLFNINAKTEFEVSYSPHYDEEVMTAYIDTFDAMKTENMTPSEDAYVKFQEGEAVIIDDITGTIVDRDLVISSIMEALDSYEKTVNIDEKGCYVPADIRSDSPSILTAYDNATEYLSIEASYEFCEDYTYTLTPEELASMAYIGDDGQVKISKTNAKLFIDKFAERFSTVQEDRKFKTHNGDLILVEGGKWYGWIINAEEEFLEFYDLIVTKKSFTKEPVCDRRGYSYSELNDIGDTYIEIDLTQQHVYVYIDGYLETHSRCVTGDINSGHKTPGGVYSITYMALDVVLTGADYESPVTFWMPFNGGIGLHDATWRASFDDDTYTYDGSHGCINLPWENARDIFYMVESGMPVICYWEDEVTFLEEE